MRGGMGEWCAARVRSCGAGGEEGMEGRRKGGATIWVARWVYLDRIRGEGAGYWGESGCRGRIPGGVREEAGLAWAKKRYRGK